MFPDSLRKQVQGRNINDFAGNRSIYGDGKVSAGGKGRIRIVHDFLPDISFKILNLHYKNHIAVLNGSTAEFLFEEIPDMDVRQGLAVEDDIFHVFLDIKENSEKNVLALNEKINSVIGDAGEMIMRFQGLSL